MTTCSRCRRPIDGARIVAEHPDAAGNLIYDLECAQLELQGVAFASVPVWRRVMYSESKTTK